MFSTIGKRFSYANVAATLALVFSMSGGALAASHYLITSSKQINPKVLAALKGKNGNAGPAGAQGAPGSQGPQGAKGDPGAAGAKGETGVAGAKGEDGAAGAQGEPGPAGPEGSPWTAGGTLPATKSETGVWVLSGNASAAAEVERSPVSFPIPLAAAPTSHYVAFGEADPTGCTGNVENPGAEPGNLCVFTRNALVNMSFAAFAPNPSQLSAFGGAGRFGAVAAFVTEGVGGFSGVGTWAVTEA